MIIDENGDIWLRQSWLDNAFRCPERARFAIVKPEWDEVTSDSALIGTGAHYGIEQVIRGRDPEKIADLAAGFVLDYDEPVKWTKYHSLPECADHAARCAVAWRDEIMPTLNLEGAKAEVTFKVPLYRRLDRMVGITGTVDLVTPTELWDWKTSARAYKPRDKQRFAIQPTIYALAAVKGGLQSTTATWPLVFRYGVMIRNMKKAKTQIVEVQRDVSHAEWALHRIRQFVDMALAFGTDASWPMIDENNYLCSATWCPWHSICRGAFLTPADDGWEPDEITAAEAA